MLGDVASLWGTVLRAGKETHQKRGGGNKPSRNTLTTSIILNLELDSYTMSDSPTLTVTFVSFQIDCDVGSVVDEFRYVGSAWRVYG